MTPRQRLLHVLAGEPTDRVPVWLLFPYHPTGYYVDVRTHPAYRRVFDMALEHGVIMLNRRNLAVRLHAPCVVYEEERGEVGQRRIMRHGATRVYAEQGGKKLLASDEDLAAFCELPIEDDPGRLAAALESQLGKYRQEQAEFPLDGGAMMLDLGSPVNTLYHAAVLEEFSIWSLTQAPLIEQWLERRLEQLEFVYRFCLERELADVYFLVGSELAAPPLVSRQTFQRWVVPYESRLISLIHSYGKRVIQHFHGQIRELLPDFLAMQPDALHTIEAPPRRQLHPDPGLRGHRGTDHAHREHPVRRLPLRNPRRHAALCARNPRRSGRPPFHPLADGRPLRPRPAGAADRQLSRLYPSRDGVLPLIADGWGQGVLRHGVEGILAQAVDQFRLDVGEAGLVAQPEDGVGAEKMALPVAQDGLHHQPEDENRGGEDGNQGAGESADGAAMPTR
ncbi:MAG: uroporphyrinogen decarboxylase family protein [Lentisphaeria bacterium]|jgi:hypothetical protein|nr:uroporphyrinogen decarboxylase family protein [Lentisphaeria bacterium]